MLDNLLYSVNAILPIILLVVLGWILKRFGKLTGAFTETADWLVFKSGLPVMLFLEVAGTAPALLQEPHQFLCGTLSSVHASGYNLEI